MALALRQLNPIHKRQVFRMKKVSFLILFFYIIILYFYSYIIILVRHQSWPYSDTDSDEKASYQGFLHGQLLKHQYKHEFSIIIRVIIINKGKLPLSPGSTSLKFFGVVSCVY